MAEEYDVIVETGDGPELWEVAVLAGEDLEFVLMEARDAGYQPQVFPAKANPLEHIPDCRAF